MLLVNFVGLAPPLVNRTARLPRENLFPERLSYYLSQRHKSQYLERYESRLGK